MQATSTSQQPGSGFRLGPHSSLKAAWALGHQASSEEAVALLLAFRLGLHGHPLTQESTWRQVELAVEFVAGVEGETGTNAVEEPPDALTSNGVLCYRAGVPKTVPQAGESSSFECHRWSIR